MRFLEFALLGLGAGAVYGLTALGVVLTYRGSGVLNFSQGAIGMIAAFVFYTWWGDHGVPAVPALLAAVLAAIGLALAMHLVIRLLGDAPGLTRMIATLAGFTVLVALANMIWGTDPRIPHRLLPSDSVDFGSGLVVGGDRLIVFGIAVGLTIVLTVVYSKSRFGLQTTAVSESPLTIARHGINPDRVAALNWGIGGAVAALGSILVVGFTGLNAVNLALLVIPALAAALVGNFRSFPLTLAGGLAIGIAQSEISFLQVKLGPSANLQGWAASVPFLVILLVLLIRPRPLPLRGAIAERLPRVGMPSLSPRLVVVAIVAVVALVTVPFSTHLLNGVTTWAVLAIVVSSLVLLTGYAGQVSLAQFTLAGMGAWVAARLVADHGVPVWLAMVAGVVAAIPIGIAVGLPALRSRGVSLAVATLGFALLIESLVLTNPDRTGGINGTRVSPLTLFGMSFDPVRFPERYAALSVIVLSLVVAALTFVRRSPAGRRMVAVRTNERAAAALGVSVTTTKLIAFSMAAAIAAVGGVLIAFRNPVVSFMPTFSVLQSIYVLVYAVIGGIGYLGGALIGALVAPGSLITSLSSGGLADQETIQLVAGVAMIAILVWLPDGLASIPSRLRRSRSTGSWMSDAQLDARWHGERLDVVELTVTFGGVTVLDDVSLHVEPGEVLGLIGPNGAGKTTCIDAITGFVPPRRGTVTVGAQDISRWGTSRRAREGLARSFQTLELFEDLTVGDNLRVWSARSSGRTRRSVRGASLTAEAQAAVTLLGLEDILDQRPGDLSAGTRRLVSIARALAGCPSILLLDEPAAGVSGPEVERLGRAIRTLAEDFGLAVVLVEHDVALVMDVCDRISVLELGRVIAEGTPDKIRADQGVVDAYLGDAAADSPVERVPVVASEVVGSLTSRVSGTDPAGSRPALLSAVDLTVAYRGGTVVDGIDLRVESGEVVALLGANGAGKTSAIHALVGVVRARRGNVEILGRGDIARLYQRARDGVGFVPDTRGIVTGLTVAENLRLGKCDRELALELAPELRALMSRKAGLLSGGEQQILALTTALARAPALVVIDELSLGLAPRVTERLLATVRTAADHGAGVLLVEQEIHRVLRVADRGYVLRRGEIVMSGSAEVLLAQLEAIESAYLGHQSLEAASTPRRP